MKKALFFLILVCILGGGGFAYYKYTNKPVPPTVNTGTLSRGPIVDSVGTTGQLSAVSQVVVGSQVSGIVLELNADFNSIVKKDQWLAKLDPTTVQTQILQARANLVRSQTDVERARVQLEDAQKKFQRSKDLQTKGVVTQADLDAAELNLHSAESGLKSSQASLQQSEASLEQQNVNMQHTTIYSPIDGLVISRAVDVGQTVNASMNAPPVFTIAADLTKMKVIAGVDESDVGRIRPHQQVTFRVDAYPAETFTGEVEQVRLEPKLQQNVVTYQTVISVPNQQLKLKPGMTANITIEITRVDGALRIPNAALRFRPTNEMYTALGLEPPADGGRGGRGGPGGREGRGGPGGPGQGAPSTGAPSTAAPTAPGAGQMAAVADGPSNGAPTMAPRPGGEGGGNRGGASAAGGATQGGGANAGRGPSPEQMARMQNMTPEERERMMAGRTGGGRSGGGRGGDGTGQGGRGNRNGGNGGNGGNANGGFGRGGNGQGGRGGNGQGGRSGRQNAPAPEAVLAQGGTIDALFPPIPHPETRGTAWTWDKDKKELTRHNLRLGVSDGQATQVIDAGELAEGAEVLTNIITASVRPGPGGAQQGNPFFGGGGRGPGGGGPPGGGGGGGGNRGGGGGGGGRGF